MSSRYKNRNKSKNRDRKHGKNSKKDKYGKHSMGQRPVDNRPLDEFTPWKDKEKDKEKREAEEALARAKEAEKAERVEEAVEEVPISLGLIEKEFEGSSEEASEVVKEELKELEVPDFNYNGDKDRLDAKKKRKKKLAIAAGILVAIVAACGIAYGSVADEDRFPDKVVVNGIDVSKMNSNEATLAFTENLNDMTVQSGDEDVKNVRTSYRFANTDRTRRLIKLSHLDVRRKIGSGSTKYKLKLEVAEGTDDTATTLRGVYPPEEGELVTQDAYIDYDKMSIVEEVQGTNIDWMKLSEDMAKQRCMDPTNSAFKFEKENYIDAPEVLKDDLKGELDFAKEYLAKGMDVEDPEGDVTHVGAKQLSKVIVYTGGGPEYSKEGAEALAQELSKGYRSSMLTIDTVEGKRDIYNYALPGGIDIDKSAKSILEAAKKKKVAKLYEDSSKAVEIGDHVEVSIGSQTVYLIQNGEITLSAPVVTGTFGHETPRGIFKLAWKQSPATLTGENDDGSDYESKVTYWMPFNGGIGLHDAPWRGAFGGDIYLGGGSHGCVNLPPYAAEAIFYSIDAGTIIMVY